MATAQKGFTALKSVLYPETHGKPLERDFVLK